MKDSKDLWTLYCGYHTEQYQQLSVLRMYGPYTATIAQTVLKMYCVEVITYVHLRADTVGACTTSRDIIYFHTSRVINL